MSNSFSKILSPLHLATIPLRNASEELKKRIRKSTTYFRAKKKTCSYTRKSYPTLSPPASPTHMPWLGSKCAMIDFNSTEFRRTYAEVQRWNSVGRIFSLKPSCSLLPWTPPFEPLVGARLLTAAVLEKKIRAEDINDSDISTWWFLEKVYSDGDDQGVSKRRGGWKRKQLSDAVDLRSSLYSPL